MEYSRRYGERRDRFLDTVASFGVSFEESESQPRAQRELAACRACCRYENGGASLGRGWISPACVACRTGQESATYFISLQCTRSCYFCFNPNQEDYEYHRTHQRDIAAELQDAFDAGKQFRFLAVTGGEPCLHPEELLAFVDRAKALYPEVHVRLYTSGDGLTDGLMDRLAAAGLDEVRFSVKPDEPAHRLEGLFQRMASAVARFPAVMVEMPVIPGTRAFMEGLLLRLDALGIKGVNLLELCFPLHNAEEFVRRGLKLRRNPYEIPYDYWYAGGLPVAGSETEALELLRFADCRELKLGVHYCSLDNKLSGQVFQQNWPFACDDALRRQFPWMSSDEEDFFVKCAKVFGTDVARVADVLGNLAEAGVLEPILDVPAEACCFLSEDDQVLSLPLPWVSAVSDCAPEVVFALSFNMVELRDGVPCIVEVAVRPW